MSTLIQSTADGKRRLIALAVAVAVATVIALKVFLFYRDILLHDVYISDESYYVVSSKLLTSRIFGFNYTPPYTVNLTVNNGTTTISISVGEWKYPAIGVPVYDWRNLEHPGLAKLIYGVIYIITGSLPGLRIALLLLSSIAYGVFAYAVVKKYWLHGVLALAVFLLVDKLVVHFTYLVFLDTLMITLLLLAVAAYMLGKRRISLVFLSLSAMCKIPGAVPALAFAGVEYKKHGLKKALLFLVVPTVALIASYGINMVFASPTEVINAVRSISTVRDYTSCATPLCLFALEEQWGFLVLTPPLIWLWIILLVARSLASEKELLMEKNIVLLVSLLNILFTVVTAITRAIYVFYYLPAAALSPVAVAELVEYLYRSRRNGLIGRLRCAPA